MILLFCLIATAGGEVLGAEQMHAVRLQHSGHLLFHGDESAIEYEWQPRLNKHVFWQEVGLFTGLGATPSFDFFEVLAGTRTDFVQWHFNDHHVGVGLILASGLSTFEFETISFTPVRACPYMPIGGSIWLINLEICLNLVYSSFNGGIGVAYEF